MRALRKRVGYLSFALVMGILWSGMQGLQAQSFFGIPLFERDQRVEGDQKVAPPKAAPAQKETPLEEWPPKLSFRWAEYKTSRAKGLTKVNEQYITALQGIKKDYTTADKLEDAIRTEREIERVEKEILLLEGEGELPALDSRSGGTPLPENTLRAYRHQMELKARGLALLNDRYVASVGEMKTKLTKADELGGALAAKRIVEVLEQENEAFKVLRAKGALASVHVSSINSKIKKGKESDDSNQWLIAWEDATAHFGANEATVLSTRNRKSPVRTQVYVRENEQFLIIPNPEDKWTGGGSKAGKFCDFRGYIPNDTKGTWMRLYYAIEDGDPKPVDPTKVLKADREGKLNLFVEDANPRGNKGEVRVVIVPKSKLYTP